MPSVHSSKEKSEIEVWNLSWGRQELTEHPSSVLVITLNLWKTGLSWNCQMPHRHFTKQEGQSYKENWADNIHSRSLFLGSYIPDNCPFFSPGHMWESDDIMRGNLDWVSRYGMAKGVIYGPGPEWQEGPAIENLNLQTCIFITDAGEWLHWAGELGNPRLYQTQFCLLEFESNWSNGT